MSRIFTEINLRCNSFARDGGTTPYDDLRSTYMQMIVRSNNYGLTATELLNSNI